MNRRRGISMIELLTAALISMIVLAVFIPSLSQLYGLNMAIADAPNTQSSAFDMAGQVASALLRAPQIGGSSVSSAAANNLTIYTSTAGATIRFYTSNGTFYEQVGRALSPLYAGANLNITYYQSVTHDASKLVAFNPSSGTLRGEIVAATVSCSVTTQGFTSNYSTTVRLRNGPPRAVSFS